jgi:hypothetical protein
MVMVTNAGGYKQAKGGMSRLDTHYLCRSSERLNNRLKLKVIEVEKEVGNDKIGDAEDEGSKMG